MRRTLFGPRITVFTKDGRSYTREGTGREFIWDFEEHVRRMQSISSGLAISEDVDERTAEDGRGYYSFRPQQAGCGSWDAWKIRMTNPTPLPTR